MYSFVFYDRQEQSLFIARDPFGIKPLYYGIFDGCFMFASEIKAFLSHPKFEKRFNSDILPYYLQFQYVPTEETAFSGVKRLAAGHMLIYKGGEIRVSRYFDLPVYTKRGYKGYSFFPSGGEKKTKFRRYRKSVGRTADRLYGVLEKSVENHTVSDVEVGGFLSGGVDSGLITAIAKPGKVYTVGFKNAGFDERAAAMKNAERFGAVLTSVEVDADDFFGCLEEVQYHSDEPYANLSAVPLYLVSKRAAQDVKVVLSGEGADELFGGYEWYEDSVFGKLYRRLPEKLRYKLAGYAGAGRIGDFIRRNVGSAEKNFIGQAKIMEPADAATLLNEEYRKEMSPYDITGKIYSEVSGATLLRKKMYLDSRLWMPYDILNKADKMTMASSLELRVPYLDLSVLSIAQGCGERLLVRGKITKCVLRAAARKKLDGEASSRPKKGFPVPFRTWIRQKKYSGILRDAFSGEICEKFFDSEKLKRMLDDHMEGRANNARVLYTVYAFIVWYGVFFEKAPVKTFVLDTEKNVQNRFAGSGIGADKLVSDTKNGGELKKVLGSRKDTEGDGDEKIFTDNSRLG